MVLSTVLRNISLALGATLSLAAIAAGSSLDMQKSKLTATFKLEGVPVEGSFSRYAANIVYDPKAPEKSSASLDVDTATYDIGDPEYNTEIRKKEWFDSSGFPKASFRSTAVKTSANGNWTVTGTLSIKGKALTINFPLSVQVVAGGRVYEGNFAISRKAFGIGSPVWGDYVADQVTVRFHLVTSGQ